MAADLDYPEVIARADLNLGSARKNEEMRESDADAAQARLAAARAWTADAVAIREFLDRHPGVPLSGLITAAALEVAAAEAESQAASEKVAQAEAAAAEAWERMRDFQGAVRVLQGKAAEASGAGHGGG